MEINLKKSEIELFEKIRQEWGFSKQDTIKELIRIGLKEWKKYSQPS